MSKKSDEHYLLEVPSKSGSSMNNWNYVFPGNRGNSDSNQYVNQYPSRNSELPIQYNVPRLVITNPLLSISSVSSSLYGLNIRQTNNFYYTGEYFPQNINRYYCQTDSTVYQHRGGQQYNNDQRLLSLRRWENVTNEKHINNKPGFTFTLMCYNVLAQDLLLQHPYLYKHHDRQNLDWNVRWNNILNEISHLKPDILCLQEVQQSHVENYFNVLESLGYSSVYKRRTGARNDGCALYYKTDLIQLVEYTTVEFFQPNVSILNRDNIGIIAKFSPKLHPTREFVVATTHLLYNPRRQDVRLAQMQILLTEIERISYSPKSEGNYLPVILTGDLNSSPDSAIYEFIVKGKLEYEKLSPRALKKDTNIFTGKTLVPAGLRITDNCQHLDLIQKRLKNENPSRAEEISIIELFHSERNNEKSDKDENVDASLFSTGTLSHNFAFKSVYSHGKPESKEGTTFQRAWVTVDYIFYSSKKGDNIDDKLKLLSRYRLPTEDELDRIHIPNSLVGSDHLSLLAKFKLEY